MYQVSYLGLKVTTMITKPATVTNIRWMANVKTQDRAQANCEQLTMMCESAKKGS